ncbi:hypothetical protein ACT89R_01620 [Rhodococcus qingshengii]
MTEPTAIRLDDPAVVQLANFLETAALSNGRIASVGPGASELLAQAVLNWQQNMVYERGSWITRADVENTPEFGEIEIRTIGNDEVFRLCHRPTGIVVLAETREQAWRQMKEQVRAAAESEANDGE